MLLVDDENIIQHKELVENLQCFIDFAGDETKFQEDGSEPLKLQKPKRKIFFIIFFNYEETQTTH